MLFKIYFGSDYFSKPFITSNDISQAIDEGGEDYEEEEEEEEEKFKKKTRKRRKKVDEEEDDEMVHTKKRKSAVLSSSTIDPRLKRQMRQLMNIVIKYTDRYTHTFAEKICYS